MKYLKYLTLCVFLTLFMASCSKDSESNDSSPEDDIFRGPTYDDLVKNGNDASPDWTYTPNVDSYQTMTVILRIPNCLYEFVSAEDKLTALAADSTVCGSAEADPDDVALYYLTIGEPACENKGVTIAFYCDMLHRIYKNVYPITFQSDEVLGSWLEPIELALK